MVDLAGTNICNATDQSVSLAFDPYQRYGELWSTTQGPLRCRGQRERQDNLRALEYSRIHFRDLFARYRLHESCP